MQVGDDAFEELRRAIDGLADADAAELVAEARAEARYRVRSMLAEAMAQALLERSREELGVDAHDARTRSASPRARGDAPAPPRARGNVQGSRRARDDVPASPRACDDPPAPRPEPASTPDLGWYVYGIVRADAEIRLEGVTGVDAARAMLIPHGPVAAVASQVPLAEFGEDAVSEHLNDADWLEGVARAHEGVLDALLQQAAVVPMRLCTLYSGEQALAELLRREGAGFADALTRLEGRSEWGLKLFANPAPAGEEEPDEQPGSGADYLRRQVAARERARRDDRRLDDCAREVHERLSAVAEDSVVNPLQRREVTGHAGEMVLNGVYLLADAAVGAFHAAVDELRERWEPRGLQLEPTGPWPAYNFVKNSIEAAR